MPIGPSWWAWSQPLSPSSRRTSWAEARPGRHGSRILELRNHATDQVPSTMFEKLHQLFMGKWIALTIAFAAFVLADYASVEVTTIIDQRAGDILLEINTDQRALSDGVVIVDIDQRSL